MQAIASERLGRWGPTLLRVVVGLIALAHVLTEVVGGAALILGLFTRLAAVPLAFSMLVATVLVHLPNGFFSSSGGVEFTLLLTVACVALALTGPGKTSLDRVLARRGIPLTGERNPTEAPARETATGGDYARGPNRVRRRGERE